MAGRSANISVAITGVADFDKARKDVARDLDKIERDAKPIELSAELDSTEIRKAIELAVQYSVEQEIIPRAFTVEECFAGAASALGNT